jgi:uncharacterized PurR-regulated membrane protein YhhQ (DUF165 family)
MTNPAYQFKYYGILIAIMVSIQTMCFILVKRHINFFGLITTASGLLFILDIYIIEIIGYCYSFEMSRQAAWINSFCHLLFFLVAIILNNIPYADTMHNEYIQAYKTLFKFSYIIVIGSFCGNLAGDMISAVFVPRFKKLFNARYSLTLLFIIHIISEFITITISYMIINLPDHYSIAYIFKLIFGTMVMKLIVSLMMLPVLSKVIQLVIKAEGLQIFDYKQNYNVFHLKADLNKTKAFDYVGYYGKKGYFS